MKKTEQLLSKFQCVPFALRAMLVATFVYPWLAYVIGASFLSGIYLPQAFNFFGYYRTGDIYRAGIVPMSPMIALFVLTIFAKQITKLQPSILRLWSFLIKYWLKCLIVYSTLVFGIAWCIMDSISSSSSCVSSDPTARLEVLRLSSPEIGLPPSTDWLFSYRQVEGVIIAKRAENFDIREFPSRLSDNENYACFSSYDWLIRLLF